MFAQFAIADDAGMPQRTRFVEGLAQAIDIPLGCDEPRPEELEGEVLATAQVLGQVHRTQQALAQLLLDLVLLADDGTTREVQLLLFRHGFSTSAGGPGRVQTPVRPYARRIDARMMQIAAHPTTAG